MPLTFTKSTSISISDSLIYGGSTKSTNQEPLILYVVNSENGYAIVPNSTLLPSVIAFSESESYKGNDMAPGFKFMMDYTAERLVYMRDSILTLKNDPLTQKLQLQLDPKAKLGDLEDIPAGGGISPPQGVEWDRWEYIIDRQWHDTMIKKTGPLLWTKWGQYYPYNSKVNEYPAGCVATAVAQIMAYHKFPSQSPSGNGASFAWNIYSTSIYYPWTSLATESIGVLFKELGLPNNLNMNYAQDGSGAPTANVPRTFKNFGYLSSPVLDYDYNTAIIHICSKGPVYISGASDQNTAHAWVVDGSYTMGLFQYKYINFYKNNQIVWSAVVNNRELAAVDGQYLHHNFGWDGSNDAWIHSIHTGWFEYKHRVNLVCPNR